MPSACTCFCHASNRFQAHEIANLRQILGWITPSGASRSELEDWQKQGLRDAASRYLREAAEDGLITAKARDESREDSAIESLAGELRGI